jgi:hypothetical protein
MPTRRSYRDDGDGFVVGDSGAQHHAGDRVKEDRLPASRCAPLRTFRTGQRVSQVVDCAHAGTSQPSLLAASSVAWRARSCTPDRAVREGQAIAWRAHNGAQFPRSRASRRVKPSRRLRAIRHVGEAAKEGTADIVARTIDTSSSRPGASVCRFHARMVTHIQDRPASQVGVDLAHRQHADRQLKEGLEGDENGVQGKRKQGALFVSPCHAITWRNL